MTDLRLERSWSPGRPVDIRATLAPLRRGAGDPAHRVDDTGVFWRAFNAPTGPVTLALRPSGNGVSATAWGSGAEWALEAVPALLGAGDDWSELDLSTQPRLARLLRGRPGLRLTRTDRVFDTLVPTILEQRVTGGEARSSWRALLYRYGSPAPGPNEALRVPPTPATILQVPTWQWHRFGVDLQRQRAIRAAATVAPRLEEAVTMSDADALRRLRVVPGIGAWSAAETAQRALGHADTVSVGDFHLHDLVVFALSGEARGDDERMLALLQPWAGHRQRVVRLIELSGVRKPRFGPRYAPLDTRSM
ncbi:3-methyladenine DNA glycosylase/8-oxoguanine DNA glycosylase [Jatrophihabitans sp. GAS493]|uniref:DNA-3-methyladenine glycosylase family protein n=1 Tax=Jatrophihabitans sp. GAS493 TaxID=1907575 RepID=UPI000BB8CC0D|nr:3-methyladenine DNA glycosylase/8-oxoguanine DNA glycosylase [Jatrophihabitans sp. GAS493]